MRTLKGSSRMALLCGTGLLASIFPAASKGQTLPAAPMVDEIVVSGKRAAADPTRIAPDAAALFRTPGDVNDPVRALLALPGITFGRGDLDDPVMRGGGPEDNTYLVDGAPVARLFHELSDSIIDPNAVRTFDLQTAAVSPEYGGATGGVLDIGLRDPRADKGHLRLDISQLKSGVLLEGPLTSNVSGYVTFRENLAHLFMEDMERGNDLLVFKMPKSRDYTARLQSRFGQTDVSLTALGSWDERREEEHPDYTGPRIFGETETRALHSQALRIRSEPADNLQIHVTASHARQDEDTREATGNFSELDVDTWALRSRVDVTLRGAKASFGANLGADDARLSFQGVAPLCDVFERTCGGIVATDPMVMTEDFTTLEGFGLLQLPLGRRLMADLGLHVAHDSYLDETFVEPRVGLSFAVRDDVNLYSRLGLHHQRPSLSRLLVLSPSPAVAKAQRSKRSTQGLVGARWDVGGDWRLQAEAWFKDFDIPDLRGTPLSIDARGEAYGADLVLAKPASRGLSVLTALSLSESTRSAMGDTFEDRYHAPFSTTLSADYTWANGWRVGAKWRGQSGTAYTPLLLVNLDPETGRPVPVFGDPYSERLDFYNRLDLRLEKRSSYNFGDITYFADVLNVTDSDNIADRTYPLRNFRLSQDGQRNILPDDEFGIPLFVVLGARLSF